MALSTMAQAGVTESVTPQVEFVERRNPPSYRALDPAMRQVFELGQAVFNTQWVPAGTPRAERRDGLGPVFNAASCDACHNNGARMRGPLLEGPAPVGLVVQLQTRKGGPSAYGEVLNTSAIDGHAAEGAVHVRFAERSGRYPDGTAWSLRAPRYEIVLVDGKRLPRDIVIKPRIAPAIFGAGLLDAVPASALRAAGTASSQPVARFGWQLGAVSLAEQTAHAFSREMGLTTAALDRDDCALRDQRCRAAANGGVPEVSAEFFAAVLAFQRALAVPRSPDDGRDGADAERLFTDAGCARCHRPGLPVEAIDAVTSIAAYTDLRRHDLGAGLADRDAAGRVIRSRWRTAPLWGLGHALSAGDGVALLHDGRARSVEEAVLWHEGEAAAERQSFMRMSAPERRRLLDWIGAR